jgi:hypothetical protein
LQGLFWQGLSALFLFQDLTPGEADLVGLVDL